MLLVRFVFGFLNEPQMSVRFGSMPLVRFVFVWFGQFGVSDQILTALYKMRSDREIYRNFGDIDNQFPWGSPRTRNKRIRLSRGRPHSSENAWHGIIPNQTNGTQTEHPNEPNIGSDCCLGS